MRLLESAGGHPLPVAASQGESQILSLSFISSIIDVAREVLGRRSELTGPESAQYPIVMDSPFGSLDPTYRYQIAEHVPALADQVVLMVTQSQWRGEVANALARRLDRQYVLTYFTPRTDIQVESIELGGAEYDLVRQSPGEFEYSMIREGVECLTGGYELRVTRQNSSRGCCERKNRASVRTQADVLAFAAGFGASRRRRRAFSQSNREPIRQEVFERQNFCSVDEPHSSIRHP